MKAKKFIRHLKTEFLTKAQLPGYMLYKALFISLIFSMMPTILYANAFGNNPQNLVKEQSASNVDLTIKPEFPIVGETTFITASGTWHNSCVPKFHSTKIAQAFGGLDVIIEAVVSEEGSCNDADTAWSVTTPVVLEKSAPTTVLFTIINNELESSSVQSVSTDFFVHHGITFQPARPQIDEPILLTVSGWAVSCIPIYESHTITEQTISININTPLSAVVCAQVAEEWAEKVNVDPLPVGRYRVEAYVHTDGDKSPKLLHAVWLTVGNPSYQIFMPIIKTGEKLAISDPCTVDDIAANFCY